jgi:hypothetical protein
MASAAFAHGERVLLEPWHIEYQNGVAAALMLEQKRVGRNDDGYNPGNRPTNRTRE